MEKKQKIRFLCACAYYFPGLKYSEKLLRKEKDFLEKLYWKRRHQISNKNRKFKWTEENRNKIFKVSEFAHAKYLEVIQKIKDLEHNIIPIVNNYPNYCIKAILYCGMELANGDDFCVEICSEYSLKKHPLEIDDWKLNKELHLPWKNLSYPIYCLLEEHKMALDEVIELTKESFYIEINIELE